MIVLLKVNIRFSELDGDHVPRGRGRGGGRGPAAGGVRGERAGGVLLRAGAGGRDRAGYRGPRRTARRAARRPHAARKSTTHLPHAYTNDNKYLQRKIYS